MDFLLVTNLLLLGTNLVATRGHTADEGLGSQVLLLPGGGDLGVLLGNMSLKTVRAKGPVDSLLPAGDAEELLPVSDPPHPLVDSHLVSLESPGLGEADGINIALV